MTSFDGNDTNCYIERKIYEVYDWLQFITPKYSSLFRLKHVSCSFNVYGRSCELNVELLEFLLPHLWGYKSNDEIFDLQSEWEIYIISEPFNIDISTLKIMTTYLDFSILKDKSGSITFTDWKNKKRWHIFFEGTKDRVFIQDIYCGIRRIIMRSLSQYSSILLHASCVRVGNKTILIVGDKGAGKSTLSHYLILKHNAKYISSDQCFLWLSKEGSVFCSGLIASVRVNINDMHLFEGYNKHIKLIDNAKLLLNDDSRIMGSKVCCTPLTYCRTMDVDFLQLSTPDIIIFLCNQSSYLDFNTLGQAEATHLFKANSLNEMMADVPFSDNDNGTLCNDDLIFNELTKSCQIYSFNRMAPFSTMEALIL